MLRIGSDATVGSVPIVGDTLDIAWKAKQRNVARIERHIAHQASINHVVGR